MPPTEPVTNRAAAEKTISELRKAKRIETVDSARIVALQSLASAVDLDPANASLWREYRAAEVALREVRDDSSDDFKELLESLSPTMGNASNAKPRNARTSGRRSG